MSSSPTLDQLIEALTCLPGVGRKSAQRMALHLIDRSREDARTLAESLTLALDKVGHCSRCRNYSDEELCGLCANPRRTSQQLCVVETPSDVIAIESSGSFSGQYFVLLGKLSPLDGIGPEELGFEKLQQRLAEEGVEEVILATNPTVEGEMTARYIADMAADMNIPVSRIAQGVPMGGELEYVDGETLMHAFSGRHQYISN